VCGGLQSLGVTWRWSVLTHLMAALLTTALLVAGGIYPDGHFDTVTKMTGANKDDVIKEAVDAGKTLFIRFIASEG